MIKFKNIFIIISIVICYIFIFNQLIPYFLEKGINLSESEKTVLIIGDFENKNSFGSQVLSGFKIAYEETSNTKTNFKFKEINIDESLVENVTVSIEDKTKEVGNKLKSELIREISNSNVICLISANTSQTIGYTMEIAKTFNIPVLITVATDESVTKKFDDVSLRLLANNSKQAETISNWVDKKFTGDQSTCGVLYSPTNYGYDLLGNLRGILGFEKIIPFSISTTTDIVGSIKYGKSVEVSSWVSISYLSESIELQVKKEKIDTINPILFSDGAYGKWIEELHQNKEKNVYLSFPETYTDSIRIKDVKGFGVFGYDAYWIIENSIKSSKEAKNNNGFSLRLREFDNRNVTSTNTIKKYKFKKGENILSKFKIYNLYESIP